MDCVGGWQNHSIKMNKSFVCHHTQLSTSHMMSPVPCLLILVFIICGGVESFQELQKRDVKKGEDAKREIKIGMFSPLICNRYLEEQRGRRQVRSANGPRISSSNLGYFTQIYCKGLNKWLNRNMVSNNRFTTAIDCKDVLKKAKGRALSGVYWIKPQKCQPIQVYCDMVTDGGGWTVFQHRIDGSEGFFRSWHDYKKGFGDLKRDFWLGNDNIHHIVRQGTYGLRFNLEDTTGNNRYAYYKSFSIGNEQQKYKLKLGSYEGNAGNGFSYHNNRPFTTYDQDHDSWSKNCAFQHDNGGWWFGACSHSNLNGIFNNKIKSGSGRYMYWYPWPGGARNMGKTSIMVRRV